MRVDERSPEKIQVSVLIKEVSELYREAAEQKNISIHNEVPSGIEAFVDRNHFMFIIRNLINNAVKFTSPGGSISISAKSMDGKTQLSVRDTGIGMSKESHAKLFEIKTTQKTYGTAGEKGTGLGLILCKEFALQNKGEIWVESEPNKGSTFFVSLPQA
jgi:two-component system sensor histidine kinase/response regulator